MRDRGLLTIKRLPEFSDYLVGLGWSIVETKGDYEVLRATHPKYKGALIVYKKMNAPMHYTTHGIAMELARQFINRTKERKSNV